MSWLLDNFHNATMATLVGFLIGSLNVTWPWKQTIETTLDRHGEVIPLVQKNVLPVVYQSTSGDSPQLLAAILLSVLGLALVLLVDGLSRKYSVN